MKRFLIICAIVAAVTALTACNNEGTDDTTNNTTSAVFTTTENTVTVTFPEGYTTTQIALKLEENGVCSAVDFMAEMSNVETYIDTYDFLSGIDNLEYRAFDLEGYIFPDTYEFYLDANVENVVKKFLDNFSAKVSEAMYERATELGYTMDEIISLASVIQSEAGEYEEMVNVSSILYNRLTSPSYGKFQCDVTINYVNDYITDSPYLEGEDTSIYAEYYNTYKCSGIQVGAICNPGIEAITAALYPAETDYYFFVTDKQWNYYYSETYEEHLENCEAVGLWDTDSDDEETTEIETTETETTIETTIETIEQIIEEETATVQSDDGSVFDNVR
ncbi:MAG: endolytic transglycosylase MltG [Clostridia bacterium]